MNIILLLRRNNSYNNNGLVDDGCFIMSYRIVSFPFLVYFLAFCFCANPAGIVATTMIRLVMCSSGRLQINFVTEIKAMK
jgi:hypothetical protein